MDDVRSEAGVPPRTSTADRSSIASRSSERWARTSRVLQVAKVLKSEADAERAAPPKKDPTFVPPHVKAQFTVDSLEDLQMSHNARESRSSRGGGTALLVSNPADALFVLPSMNTMLKFRAFMSRWRRRWAERPAEKPCIERPKGEHVAVTRNQETIRRAMADPATVRCTHLLRCEAVTGGIRGGVGGIRGGGVRGGGVRGGGVLGNVGEEEVGYWGADGRWETPAVLRVVRMAQPGTPKHAKHVLCRVCFDRLQARRGASVVSCRRCQMSVPRSVMVMRRRAGRRGGGGIEGGGGGRGEVGDENDIRRPVDATGTGTWTGLGTGTGTGTGTGSPASPSNPFGSPFKASPGSHSSPSNPFGSPFNASPGSPSGGAEGTTRGGHVDDDELPLCLFCEKLESKQSRMARQFARLEIGPSPLQLEEMQHSGWVDESSQQSPPRSRASHSSITQGDRLAQRLHFRSPTPESHAPQRQERHSAALTQKSSAPAVGSVMAALGDEAEAAVKERAAVEGTLSQHGASTLSSLGRTPRQNCAFSASGFEASTQPSIACAPTTPSPPLHSPWPSATPTFGDSPSPASFSSARSAATPPTPSLAVSCSAETRGRQDHGQSQTERRNGGPGDSASLSTRSFNLTGRQAHRRLGLEADADEDADDPAMSRLMTHPSRGRAPLPSPGRHLSVTPVCGFMDSDDVPGIAAVAKAASVRWDPVNRVVVSTERERRFLYGEERRSAVNELGRGGPEDGLRWGSMRGT